MQKKYKTNKHPVFSHLHIGVAALAALLMFGVAEVSNYHALHQQTIVSGEGVITLESREEKKTMRMPVRYQDGLRPVTIGGS